MDYRELTKEDIEQYEAEIKSFMNYRNILFWCAIGSFSGATTFLIAAIFLRSIQYQFYEWSLWLFAFSIVSGIACFILRSALFNSRINNRKVLIQKAKKYQREQEENKE